jgi:hypothetical protein
MKNVCYLHYNGFLILAQRLGRFTVVGVLNWRSDNFLNGLK